MRRLALALALAALGGAALAPAAAGEFGLSEFDVTFTDQEGATVTQAGAHPFGMDVSLRFISVPTGEGGEETEEAAKDVLVDQVEGLAGNPTAVPRCANLDFLTEAGGLESPECPDSSALGIAEVTLSGKEGSSTFYGALYNLIPPPGSAAKLGFWVSQVPVTIELGVSETFPYKITGGPTNLSQILEVLGSRLTIWGTPADPAHDPLRGHCLSTASGGSLGECPAGISVTPFLTLPRACKGPLRTTYRIDSWQNPGVFVEGFAETHDALQNPVGMSGCGKLDFGPELQIAPSATTAESAAGLQLDITATDEGLANPAGFAAADIEETHFALPAGLTLNPSAAEGLGVCSLAQYESASPKELGCPPQAKLGSLEAETPILENHTFRGSVYLAAQRENPFGSLFAAYLIVRDPELGVFVKLASEIETDPASGRVTAAVAQMPPYPFSRIAVRLRQGPRAPLITPPLCGEYHSEAALTPSSGAAALASKPAFSISAGPGGGPCPAGGTPPFAPGFEAGTLNNAAGSYAPFYMRLTRGDGEQDVTRFSVALAPGISGKIAGLSRCLDSAIVAARAKSGKEELAAPSCPGSSLLGRTVAGAGVGTALTYVEGTLHLAGPYNGAPLSVVSIVPAVAGPFDVGTVVTRVALRLNPDNAQVEVDGAASDPIPHILEGIPLKVRDLRVFAERPEFTLNPTSCSEAASAATIYGSGADPFSGADDSTVARSARFQAASCASLGFKPNLKLLLSGATKRAKNPAFRAELKTRGADANLKGAIVTLPPSLFIDNAHISNPCTRVQFAQNNCPKRSILGRGRAFTPLLDAPLEGPVYFRSNGGERKLPDLVVALKGQFEFNLVIAVLQAKKGRVRTKVLNAPDAPVSKFVLRMSGGNKGLLENSEFLCRKKQRGFLNLIGQNGRRHKTKPVVKVKACKKRSARRVRR